MNRRPALALMLLALAAHLAACDAPFPRLGPGTVQGAAADPSEDPPDTRSQPTRVAQEATPQVVPPGAGAFIEDEQNTIDVFEAVAPATVFVTQKQLVRSHYSAEPLEVPAGTGTGFIWDTEGHVVTNYHVVDGGKSFTVTLYNQKSYDAKLVGGEPRKDIAVLKIDAPAEELAAVRLPPKKSSKIVVGQKALAIGNPFGLDHSLTVGVISALDREMKGYGGVTIRDMVQTDASINPGNSGGPLLDSKGQLIGMNTMIFSKTGASAGIGFAVPVSTVRRLVPQIIKTGRAEQVGLGVSIIQDAVARRAGVKGVIIREVAPDSPAALAGLEGLRYERGEVLIGDVIVGIDAEAIGSYDDLYNALDTHKAGDKVQVRVQRGKKEVQVEVELFLLQ